MERLDLRAGERASGARRGFARVPLTRLLIANTSIGDEMRGPHEQPGECVRRRDLGERTGFVESRSALEIAEELEGRPLCACELAPEREHDGPTQEGE